MMDVEEEELDKWEGELIFFERKQQRNEKKTKREREQRKKINKENDQTFKNHKRLTMNRSGKQ